jgi:hypothetical protein
MESFAPPLQESIAGQRSPLGLYAPSPVYLTGEEQLRITTVSNTAGLTLTIAGRILGPDNRVRPFEFPHTPNSNRTTATTTIALSEGWLLGLEAKVTSGTMTFGAVWALMELVRGQGNAARVVSSLQSDFVTPVSPLEWPGEAAVNSLESDGCLRSIVGTLPGAGVEISETVPTGARWELLALHLALITSATVANRIPALSLDDGASLYFASCAAGNETASATWSNEFGQGTGFSFNATGLISNAALPVGIKLPAGGRIRSSTIALQAGDQYAAPRYLVREWFDV